MDENDIQISEFLKDYLVVMGGNEARIQRLFLENTGLHHPDRFTKCLVGGAVCGHGFA